MVIYILRKQSPVNMNLKDLAMCCTTALHPILSATFQIVQPVTERGTLLHMQIITSEIISVAAMLKHSSHFCSNVLLCRETQSLSVFFSTSQWSVGGYKHEITPQEGNSIQKHCSTKIRFIKQGIFFTNKPANQVG